MTSTHVLITGAGMVGAYTARRLIDTGHRVTLLDRSVPHDYLDAVLGDRPYATVEIDLTDGAGTEEELAALDPVEAIVHTAALIAARAQRDLSETLEVNVAVPVRLARWAADHGVRRLVALSSWSVFSETQSRPITRDSDVETQFTSYYVATKLAMEHLLSALAHATPLEVAVLRPTVIYGYGPNLGGGVGSAVIEGQVIRAIEGQPVRLPRNIISRTELVYIEDAAAAAAAAVTADLGGLPFEWFVVGSQQTTTVDELAATLRDVFPGVSVDVEDGDTSSVVPPRQDQPTDMTETIARLGIDPPLDRTEGFRRFADVLRSTEAKGVKA